MNSSDTSDPAEACIRAFAQNISGEAVDAATEDYWQLGKPVDGPVKSGFKSAI